MRYLVTQNAAAKRQILFQMSHYSSVGAVSFIAFSVVNDRGCIDGTIISFTTPKYLLRRYSPETSLPKDHSAVMTLPECNAESTSRLDDRIRALASIH